MLLSLQVFVVIACVALLTSITNGYRFKRQEELATTATTKNFDDFLNDMLKELGIGIDEDALATDAIVNGTTSLHNETVGPLANGTDSSQLSKYNETTEESSTTPYVAQPISTKEPLGNSTIPLSQNGSTNNTNAILTNTIESGTNAATTEISTNSATAAVEEAVLPPPVLADSIESPATNENCMVEAVLSDFCKIPDDMLQFIGPSADIHDISDFVISMHLVDLLAKTCPPGSWCLDTEDKEHGYEHLEDKVAFWSNSSDFTRLCWYPIDTCLRSAVEFYASCPIYWMYVLIEETYRLLCEMKKEPMASRECIEQTLKALHVTMADFHRESLDSPETDDVCKSRNASMTKNYLCAKTVCGDYTDLLNEFKSWEFFLPYVEPISKTCPFDPSKCFPQVEKEQDTLEEEEEERKEDADQTSADKSGNSSDEDQYTVGLSGTSGQHTGKNENAGTLVSLSDMDIPTVVVVSAVCVAALAFLLLVTVIMCLRRRKSKYRTREGVEYMEILPDVDD